MKSLFTALKLFLVLMVASYSVNSEIFSCMVQLKQTVEVVRQQNITDYLYGYIEQHRQIYRLLDELVGHFEGTTSIIKTGYRLLEHPLGAFRFVWNSKNSLVGPNKEVIARLNDTSTKFNIRHMLGVFAKFPTPNDVHGSADGILAIQEVHKFPTTEVANGKLGIYGSNRLSYGERLDIARTVPGARLWVENEEYYAHARAIEWIGVTIDVATDKRQAFQLFTFVEDGFEKIHCVCSFQYHHMIRKLQGLNKHISAHKNCTSVMPFPCSRLKDGGLKNPPQLNFEALCRGEKPSPLAEPDRITPNRLLRCRYSHFNDPRLILDRVKEEELNLNNPRISVLHDILTDKHIEYFQEIASPRLRRGPVTSKDGAKRTYHKISQQYVVPGTKYNPVTKNLVGRLSGVSKLAVGSFEDIMVVNYGTGGVYGVHLDVLTRESHANYSRGMFNRLTTIVTYMNDVKFGGETVFPDIGIKVKPQKGSAVMFFNMYRNGETNVLSRHSSCPIVYGEKWIANQWIRNWGQEFDYQCSTDIFE